jgi:hypothetical protein
MKGIPGSLSIAAGESEQSSTVVWQKSGHQGDGYDITYILLKVALNTIKPNQTILYPRIAQPLPT